jgi:hypothetical protein
MTIAARAELAYDPVPYSGAVVVSAAMVSTTTQTRLGRTGRFHRDRGRAGKASGHRMMLAEPWIGFVADRLQELVDTIPLDTRFAAVDDVRGSSAPAMPG